MTGPISHAYPSFFDLLLPCTFPLCRKYIGNFRQRYLATIDYSNFDYSAPAAVAERFDKELAAERINR
jgi:hypothetical protein